MATRTPARRTTRAAKPDAEVEEVPVTARPTRRRRSATAKPVESNDDAGVEIEDEEPAAKPRRRRLNSVKPVEEPVEVDDDDDEEPAAKPVRRAAKPAATKRAAAKPVADEEPDDGMTPNQRKMAALRAKRKPAGEKPTKPAAPKRAPIEFGTNWLAELVTQETGKSVDSFALRAVLRRMAGQGTLKREIGVERARYEFSGPNDPTVKAVLAAYKSGEADEAKKEKLAALKASKKPAAKKPAAKPARGRAKPAPEPVDEDDEYDDDDDVDELD